MSIPTPLRPAIAGLLAALLVISGCGTGESGAEVGATTGSRKAVASARAAADDEMVAAVSTGKGAVPIDMRFALASKPVLSQPLDVTVSITPRSEIERLQVVFQSTDGLSVGGNGNLGPIDNPRVGTPMLHAVTVTPKRDGVLYLSAVALIESDAVSVSRSFAIPIIVGELSDRTPADESAGKPGAASTAEGTTG